MAHICPFCFNPAPTLFGSCPECDKDLPKSCTDGECDHCWTTRDDMIERSKK